MHTGPEINLNLFTVISSSRGVFNRLHRSNIHISQSIRVCKCILVRVTLHAQARLIQTILLLLYFLFVSCVHCFWALWAIYAQLYYFHLIFTWRKQIITRHSYNLFSSIVITVFNSFLFSQNYTSAIVILREKMKEKMLKRLRVCRAYTAKGLH